MTQLQNAFSHLLPILDDPDYIPLANSTALDDAAEPLDQAFLNYVLTDTNRLLLSSDNPVPSTDESLNDHSDSTVPSTLCPQIALNVLSEWSLRDSPVDGTGLSLESRSLLVST